MAGETNIVVAGNLTADPELRFTPSGAAVVNFSIASTPRTYDRESGQWRDGETTFFRVSAWRDQAENVAESLSKGDRVMVSGTLKIRQYETAEGQRGTSVEIDAEDVAPSLKFATAAVKRASRSSLKAVAAEDPWAGTKTA